jgi:GNAT superfamily N-acetyltransferase
MDVDGLSVAFRAALPDDEAIVFNAWLLAHRKHGDWPPRLSSQRYFAEHKATIAKLIARSRMLVACNEQRPSQVLGFVCWEGGNGEQTLHWLFVKQPFRRNGIGQALLNQAMPDRMPQGGRAEHLRCSHWTMRAEQLRAAGHRWRYDPFALEVRS